METRMHGNVEEHKHPETGHDYWHVAVRQHAQRDNAIKSISICVTHEDGNIEKEEIDLNQLFIFDITRAIRNGHDPIEAMILLLNVGSKYVEEDEYRYSRENVLGIDSVQKERTSAIKSNCGV